MFFFSAYGLTFESEVDLNGFNKIQRCKADVLVTSSANKAPSAKPERSLSLHKLKNGLRIHWPKVASYYIEEGCKVSIRPQSALQPVLLGQPLYGIAMAAVLQQNNLLVLHGSSVVINKQALVLIGKKGLGKSTLTGCLLARKNFFLSDDVTALVINDTSSPTVLPGIPRLRLWSDAINAIGLNPNDIPLLPYNIPKHNLCVTDRFIYKEAPLRVIVMLDHGDTIDLHKMTESEKMIWLIGGQYFAKFHDAIQPAAHSLAFRQCSYLATKIDIVRLTMPRDINALPAVTTLLEQYMT